MSQAYGTVYVHLVFTTKNREALLSPSVHAEFAKYVAPILKDHRARFIAEGGMQDHVHLLIDLGRETSVATILREIKTKSSAWLRKKTGKHLSWQSGNAMFSVSPSELANVVKYIENQEKYHRHKTFQEELEEMLKEAGVEYDPKQLMVEDGRP